MNAQEVLARLSESGTPPDPETALKISVGLGEALRRLCDESLPFLADGGNELKFVFAPYGRGKTHLLQAYRETAISRGFITAYVDCRTGDSPFASLQETYRAIASAICPPLPPTGITFHSHGIRSLIEASISNGPIADGKEVVARIEGDDHLTAEYRALASAYARAFIQGDDMLRDDIGNLLAATTSARVTLGELYRQHRWLPRPIGKLGRRNAAAWLRSLASLPSVLGYGGLVVLFDETEPAYSRKRLKSRQIRTHLANMRNFVDHMALGNYRSCAVYYAVVEEFIEIARQELDALSQRIERVRIGESGETRNHRAVWVDLDELTDPPPTEQVFFESLSENIIGLGIEAGLAPAAAAKLRQRYLQQAGSQANSINAGAVRLFVKAVAGDIAAEVAHNASTTPQA